MTLAREVTPGYRLGRAAVRGLLWFLFAYRTAGEEHCPRTGPVIAVSNHRSWLDPVVGGMALRRRAVFIVAEDLLGERVHPGFVPWRGLLSVIAPFLRWYGVIPVPRTEVDATAYTGSAVRAALRLLREGGCLAVAPEGGVNTTSEPLAPLRNGVALLSARGRAPILPMWLFGTDRAMPLGDVVFRPSPISVRIGPPLPPPPGDSAADIERTTQGLRDAMLELYRQGPL
jgi:1-acyl-sn-glycerol-3-phosphate acyltransferase